jgi:hypothetical protein
MSTNPVPAANSQYQPYSSLQLRTRLQYPAVPPVLSQQRRLLGQRCIVRVLRDLVIKVQFDEDMPEINEIVEVAQRAAYAAAGKQR